MNQDDYKTEFEEHREEIKLDELNPSSTAHLPSRSERYRKNRPKRKSRHRLINTILGLFILIPLIILIIVIYDYYNPDHNTAAGDSGIVMEPPGTDDKNDEPDVDVIIDQPDEEDQEPSNDLEENKQPVSGVDSEVVEDTDEEEPSSEDKQVDANEGQSSSQVEEKSSSQTHTVSKGETIFRISVIYYKDGSGVDKIKEANGLTSNHIIVGQKLIIP